VLGKLSSEEISEVERYAKQYPEIRQEINSIEEALKTYAMLHGKTPPPGVLSEVLTKIDNRQSASQSANNSRTAVFLAAFLAVALGAMAAYFYQQNQQLQDNLDQLAGQMAIQQASCDSISNANNILRQEIELLRQPNTKSIIMNGTASSPNAIASVFYNSEEQRTILNVVDLPVPPEGKQYQLWAFVEDNPNPVSVGVFDLQQDTALQNVQFIANAQNFAISLEDEGGSPVPTDVHLLGVGS
jgi:anti-sigma-K factor RskA